LTARRSILFGTLLFTASFCRAWPACAGDEWQPISEEELKMTSEPRAPGAPAIILYRQVDHDDSATHPSEYSYVRIKILKEEGRKYADVEIPYYEKTEKILDLKARTIHPDGTILDFNGQVFNKEMVKARRFKVLIKTFTLSDVQAGSIIEYQYVRQNRQSFLEFFANSEWVLSQELFTKQARFFLKRYPGFALRCSWPNGLPDESTPPTVAAGTYRLEAQNIPAFEAEENMPPEDAIRFKVDFIYTDPRLVASPEVFWRRLGEGLDMQTEAFVQKHKLLEQALAQIVAAGDSPETKLQKIYARAQQIRNTSFEKEKTEQEEKRAKEKEIKNVEELWKEGRGSGAQVTWAFLALVRAGGFDAYPVFLATRDNHFFNPKLMNADDLNTNAVLVRLDGKDLYFDPGSKFTPFGLLPWQETGVQGLKLDKDGGAWIMTPYPDSSSSQIERKAELKVSEEGSLEGKLSVTYSGLEAAWRRIVERDEDDAQRKKFLEEEVATSVPAAPEVELTNTPDWTSSAPRLVAEFHLKVPAWISSAGRRSLLPVGLFSAQEKHACEHATRVHPLYFEWKFQKVDDIRIELPEGWQIGSLPPRQGNQSSLVGYSLNVENDKGTLHVARVLRSDVISLEQNQYAGLRDFYQAVRTGDEQQIVLQQSGSTAGN